MKAYKGFDKNLKCRGFQYEVGKEYETNQAEVCKRGFHACEHPFDCFGYYSPGEGSVYHKVKIYGKIDRKENGDTKVAATKIKIGARLTIAGLVKAAIEYTMARIKPEAKVDEDYGAASATGYSGAASATGDSGAASVDNPTAIAVAWGYYGRAKGVVGAHIVLADWRLDRSHKWILHGANMVRIDGKKYKPDTWYTLENGKIVEVED